MAETNASPNLRLRIRRNASGIVGEFRDILKKSDDTIKDDYIEELIEKMNGLTRPQWIMMKEANYRYWTARKGGLGASDSLEFVFKNARVP